MPAPSGQKNRANRPNDRASAFAGSVFGKLTKIRPWRREFGPRIASGASESEIRINVRNVAWNRSWAHPGPGKWHSGGYSSPQMASIATSDPFWRPLAHRAMRLARPARPVAAQTSAPMHALIMLFLVAYYPMVIMVRYWLS